MFSSLIKKLYDIPPARFIRQGIAGKIDKRLDPVLSKLDQINARQEEFAKIIQQTHNKLDHAYKELDDRHVRTIQMLQLSQWWTKEIMTRQEIMPTGPEAAWLLDDFSTVLQRVFSPEFSITAPDDALLLSSILQSYIYDGGPWRLRQEINKFLTVPAPRVPGKAAPPPNAAQQLKILVVSGMFPAIEHGGGLRLFDILHQLGERHQIDLYSAYDETLDAHTRTILEPKLDNIRLVANEQIIDESWVKKDLAAWLQELGRDGNYYDAVQLEYPHTAFLIPEMKQYGSRVGFTFMECVTKSNVIKIEALLRTNRLKDMPRFAVEFWKGLMTEQFAMRHADFLIAVTPEDATFLEKLHPRTPNVIPTCLSQREVIDKIENSTVEAEPGCVAFLGYFGHYPNIDSMQWYLSEIHPLVKREVPDYRMLVIGAGDTSVLEEQVAGDHAVEFTGRVDDITAYIQRASVCILPLISGAGIRGKLNQYSIARRPSVSTSIGNKGLGYEHGFSVMIADQADDFAKAIIELLSNDSQRKEMGRRAEEHARKHFSWQRHLETLEQIYRGQMETR